MGERKNALPYRPSLTLLPGGSIGGVQETELCGGAGAVGLAYLEQGENTPYRT